MRRVFSGFLAGLDEKGEPRDSGLWQSMWKELRRELRRELQRRRLWELSPAILGVVGMARWQTEPVAGSLQGRSLEALDELAHDAYHFIFIDRFDLLRRHLEVKGEIEGLVRLNVRNYIYETQRRHDPLGTRIFGIVKSAVELALERRTLFVLSGGPKLSNDTWLGTRSDAVAESGAEEQLEELARAWNDDLLDRMMTADGKSRLEVLADLAGRLARLEHRGVRAFPFGRLITPIKNDARRRWGAILGADAQHWSEVSGLDDSRALGPHNSSQRVEDRDRFTKLSRCVEQRLSNLPGQRRTRNHRLHLWRYLHRFSWEVEESPEDLPSHRELARMLGIPRERFRELYDTIGEELRRCLRAMRTDPSWVRGASSLAEGSRMERTELRDRLLEATARAVRSGESRSPEAFTSVEGGQIHTLAETSSEGIEWLILELDPRAGARVVPVDTFPMAGRPDLEISQPGSGPLVARLDLVCWIPLSCLRPETSSLRLSDADFERVLVARARHVTGRAEPSVLDEEIELDPEYLEWRETVRSAGRRLVKDETPLVWSPEETAMVGPSAPRSARQWRRPMAIAAALLLFSLGGWLAALLRNESIAELRSIADLQSVQAKELAAVGQRAAAAVSVEKDPVEILRSIPVLRFQVLVPDMVTRSATVEGASDEAAPTDSPQLFLLLLGDAYAQSGDRLTLFSSDGGEAASPLAIFPAEWTEDGALVAIPTSLLAGGDEFRLDLSSSLGGEVLETYHLKTQ